MIRRLYEKYKAWRRGERMIKGVNRGRCFEKKEQDDEFKTVSKSEVQVRARIIRANGEIEEL